MPLGKKPETFIKVDVVQLLQRFNYPRNVYRNIFMFKWSVKSLLKDDVCCHGNAIADAFDKGGTAARVRFFFKKKASLF